MANEYINVRGQDGETYEVLPTDALLHFLQRMAEGQAPPDCIRGLVKPSDSHWKANKRKCKTSLPKLRCEHALLGV